MTVDGVQSNPKHVKRKVPITDVYLQLAWELRKQLRRRGLTMQECDDKSGLNDGHTAHLLHPETLNGRQARWDTLQTLMEALYPGGFRLTVRPMHAAARNCQKIDLRAGATGRIAVRDFACQIASQGGKARAAKLSPSRLSCLARRAARARWARQRRKA